MKTYEDLAGDGGSNIVEQVQALGEKLRSRLDRIKHKVALMSGKGGVGKSSLTANVAACLVDKGYTVENIAFVGGSYIVVSLFLLFFFRKTLEPTKFKE